MPSLSLSEKKNSKKAEPMILNPWSILATSLRLKIQSSPIFYQLLKHLMESKLKEEWSKQVYQTCLSKRKTLMQRTRYLKMMELLYLQKKILERIRLWWFSILFKSSSKLANAYFVLVSSSLTFWCSASPLLTWTTTSERNDCHNATNHETRTKTIKH